MPTLSGTQEVVKCSRQETINVTEIVMITANTEFLSSSSSTDYIVQNVSPSPAGSHLPSSSDSPKEFSFAMIWHFLSIHELRRRPTPEGYSLKCPLIHFCLCVWGLRVSTSSSGLIDWKGRRTSLIRFIPVVATRHCLVVSSS